MCPDVIEVVDETPDVEVIEDVEPDVVEVTDEQPSFDDMLRFLTMRNLGLTTGSERVDSG
jgi:hypothetical protein